MRSADSSLLDCIPWGPLRTTVIAKASMFIVGTIARVSSFMATSFVDLARRFVIDYPAVPILVAVEVTSINLIIVKESFVKISVASIRLVIVVRVSKEGEVGF